MPDENGLSLLQAPAPATITFRAIILSIYDTRPLCKSARRGCKRLSDQALRPEELVQAVRTIGMGGHYLCADAVKALRGGEPMPKSA